MKSRKIHLLFLLMLLSLLSGCKKVESGLADIIWQINFDLVTTTWDVQFIDAATGLPVGANNNDRIEVTITGGDKNNILDLAGVRQTRFYSTKGVLALCLHPDRAVPDPQTPVKFVIHANHEAYLPVNVPVTSYHEGVNPIKVYLINRSNAPENVDLLAQTQVGRMVDGKLTDSLTLKTALNYSTLAIAAGTEFHAASGAQLAGDLTFAFSYWEGSTVNGLKTFPGGQVTRNIVGNPGLIYLACGLYVDIHDADRKYTSQVSQPMVCKAIINKAVYNPLTKAKLVAGETVPIWYMNPATDLWENKGSTIIQTIDNNLVANLSLESTGLYLVGWIDENLCSSFAVLHPNTLAQFQEIPYAFTISIFQTFNNELRFIQSTSISGKATEDYDIHFLPDNSELVVRFEPYTYENSPYYKTPDPVFLAGFCQSGNPVNFSLQPKTGSTFKKIKVVFIDVLHNNTRYIPKVFPGCYRKSGTTVWQSAFVYGGQAYMVNTMEGDLFEMGINFKGGFHQKQVTIGSEEYTLVEITLE